MTMTGHLRPGLSHRTGNPAGVLSAILGGLGFAGFVWTWLVTAAIDPPAWVRVPGLLLLPLGTLGSLGIGVVGLLTRPRGWAAVGLTLGLLSVVGLSILEVGHD
jgi:hypothetical protein